MLTICITCIHIYVPVFGQTKHCSVKANDTPDNSMQHCLKDNELSLLVGSPSQLFVLKQTGAVYMYKANH